MERTPNESDAGRGGQPLRRYSEGGGGTGCWAVSARHRVKLMRTVKKRSCMPLRGSEWRLPRGDLSWDANGMLTALPRRAVRSSVTVVGCGILFRLHWWCRDDTYTFCDCEGSACRGGTLVLDGAGPISTARRAAAETVTAPSFQVHADSIETALYTFQGPPNDGAFPDCLIGDAQG